MRYVAAAVGLVVGLILGAVIGVVASNSDPKDSDEYRSQVASQAEASERAEVTLDEAMVDLQAATDEVQEIRTSYAALEGDLPAREAEVDRLLGELEADQKILQKGKRDTLALLDELERREEAVGIVERRIARNTIAGDAGVYRVGEDMKPGTYRSENGAARPCYWQISSDANGNEISANSFAGGPQFVSVSEGQFFSTQDCGDWTLQ